MDTDLKLLVVLVTLSFAIGTVSAFTYSVDNRTEWEEGDFKNSTYDRGGLLLESSGVQVDWVNTTYDYLIHDVEKREEYDDYVYVAGTDNNGDGAVWKYDKTGDTIWKYTESDTIRKIELDENYLYATTWSNDVRKIRQTDGSEVAIFNQPDNNALTLDIKNNSLYIPSTNDGILWKINKSDPSDVLWRKNISKMLGYNFQIVSLEVSNSGEVFAGGPELVKLNSDGSFNDYAQSSRDTWFRSLEIGTDQKLYSGGGLKNVGGFVERYDSDLNREWEYYTDNRTFDIDLDIANNIYAVTTYLDDSTYKINKSGSLKWVIKDPESQEGVESHATGAYSGGKLNNANEGILSRFIETYVDKGDYNSTTFSSGSSSSWRLMTVESDLKGQSANITFQSSNDGFLTIEDSKEFELSGGTETFDISTNADDARFKIDVDGSNLFTPVIDFVTLNEQIDSALKCNEHGLIGCWKMEAGSGQVVYDYSDRNNHGSRGYLFSPDSEDPAWINDSSHCISGGCLNFSKPDNVGQVTIPDSDNLTFEEFSLTGSIKLDSGDGSPGTIIHKEDEIQVVANYSNGKIAASIYNTTVCGGWCGTDSVMLANHDFYVSDMQADYDEWYSLRVTWNGTHFSFYNKSGLVDRGSPPAVTSYTIPEDNSADLLIGAEGRNQGSHLEGPMDEIKLYNNSDLGFVPGTVVCNPAQEGAYTNIGERGEDTGRLKNDRERCLQDSAGNYEFFDQDYGDVTGDGVQDTCRENNLYGKRGVRWISKDTVEDYPQAFTGGIDDDKTRFTSENFESLPDQDMWNTDETPVPTGTSETHTSTRGFCGGDDEGEYLITQECNTGLCGSDNSVIGVAKLPKSCVLNGQNYDLKNPENEQRKIYSQGENVTFNLGSEYQSVACFDGVWYDKWPISAGPTRTMEIGKGQTSSYNFKVINIQDVRKEFRIELQGDEEAKRFTDFEGRTGDSFEINVPSKSSKNIRVNVFGGNSNVDDATIRVQATALTGDISGEDSFKIDILDSTVSSPGMPQTQNVPGIGLTHLIAILLISVIGRYFAIDQ